MQWKCLNKNVKLGKSKESRLNDNSKEWKKSQEKILRLNVLNDVPERLLTESLSYLASKARWVPERERSPSLAFCHIVHMICGLMRDGVDDVHLLSLLDACSPHARQCSTLSTGLTPVVPSSSLQLFHVLPSIMDHRARISRQWESGNHTSLERHIRLTPGIMRNWEYNVK